METEARLGTTLSPPSQLDRSSWDGLRRLIADSRVLTVCVGMTLLMSAASLYLFDPHLYLRLMRIWVPETLPVPFADAKYIFSQLDCWRQGIDVYKASPCDLFGRGFPYPPIWLRLWFLPALPQAGAPLGFIIGCTFVISLSVLPRLSSVRDTLLLLSAVASSAVAYGVERGNIDLLVFALAALTIVTIDRSLPARAAGYAGATAAALLKLYPLVLLVLIAREKRPARMVLGGLVLAIGVVAATAWHDQWIRMLPNVPGPLYSSDGFGAPKLPEGLFILIDWLTRHVVPGSAWHLEALIPRRAGTAILFLAVLSGAAFAALRIARIPAFAGTVAKLSPRHKSALMVGALLFCGCFVAGTSIAYREVFLLFALPALLSFQYESALWPLMRWIGVMTIPLMWCSFPALCLDMAFGPMDATGGPVITVAFWLVRELVWWWLFILLSAVLFRIAEQGRLGAPAVTVIRPPPDPD